jgi:hypothetical protein
MTTTRSRLRRSATRAYETPSTAFLRVGWSQQVWLVTFLAALSVALVFGIAPEFPNRLVIALQTFLTLILSYVLMFRVVSYISAARLEKLRMVVFIAFILLVSAYVYLTVRYTVVLPGSPDRILVSHQLTPEATRYLAQINPPDERKLIMAFGRDRLNEIYTQASLNRLRVLQLGLWFSCVFLSACEFVLAIIPMKRLWANSQASLYLGN